MPVALTGRRVTVLRLAASIKYALRLAPEFCRIVAADFLPQLHPMIRYLVLLILKFNNALEHGLGWLHESDSRYVILLAFLTILSPMLAFFTGDWAVIGLSLVLSSYLYTLVQGFLPLALEEQGLDDDSNSDEESEVGDEDDHPEH